MLGFTACSTQQAQSSPPKQAPPPLEFLGEWGTRGDGPGQLSGPTGIAVDTVGNVFIADSGNKFVHKFTAEGHPLQSFQDPFLKEPAGIALDLGNAIYVSDCRQNAVQVFLATADRFLVIRGSAAHHLNCPTAVVVDAGGLVFVLDEQGHRIQEFDARGRWLKAWGKQGAADEEFRSATSLSIGADDLLYVLDDGNHRVQKFNTQAEIIGQWELPVPPGVMPEGNWFSSIAVLHEHVFLANCQRRTIDVWTLDGQHTLETNGGGRLQSEKPGPLYLAASPHGELFMLDPIAARVFRFRLNF